LQIQQPIITVVSMQPSTNNILIYMPGEEQMQGVYMETLYLHKLVRNIQEELTLLLCQISPLTSGRPKKFAQKDSRKVNT